MTEELTVLKIKPEHKEYITKFQGLIAYVTGKQVSQSETCYIACKVLINLLDIYEKDEVFQETVNNEIIDITEELS